jgi:hypothetical protein
MPNEFFCANPFRGEFHRVPTAHNCRIVGMAAAPTTRASRRDLQYSKSPGLLSRFGGLCVAAHAGLQRLRQRGRVAEVASIEAGE